MNQRAANVPGTLCALEQTKLSLTSLTKLNVKNHWPVTKGLRWSSHNHHVHFLLSGTCSEEEGLSGRWGFVGCVSSALVALCHHSTMCSEGGGAGGNYKNLMTEREKGEEENMENLR